MDVCNVPPSQAAAIYTTSPNPAAQPNPSGNSSAYQPPLKAAPLLAGQGTRVDRFA